jgi:hypothetical protein
MLLHSPQTDRWQSEQMPIAKVPHEQRAVLALAVAPS